MGLATRRGMESCLKPPPARTLASIADRAARAFPSNAYLPGFTVFSARKIELAIIEESSVEAVVKTKRVERVSLRARDGDLLIRCSCPASAVGFVGCKHAWAALLEIDRQRALGVLRGSRAPLRVASLEAATPSEPGEPREGAPAPSSSRRLRKAAIKKRSSRPRARAAS
jgi:hypothetical protein